MDNGSSNPGKIRRGLLKATIYRILDAHEQIVKPAWIMVVFYFVRSNVEAVGKKY